MSARTSMLGSLGFAAIITAAVLGPGALSRAAPSSKAPRSDTGQGVSPVGGKTAASATGGLDAHENGRSLVCEFLGRSAIPAGSDVHGHAGSTASSECPTKFRGTDIRVLLVTLPDPISSHLDWSYDAGLESVLRAFERSGYVVDRFWLPWRRRADTATATGLARSLPGTSHPGVLLLRSVASDTLTLFLVYIVGEVPTSGVHRPALREALDEIRDLELLGAPGGTDSLRVVGPVFSGSSRSLKAGIVDALDASDPAHAWHLTVSVVSGSASSPGNAAVLNDIDVPMQFVATVHTSRALQAAEQVVLHALGIQAGEIAFLHESSTVYGMSAHVSDSALTLTFPMNISSLRTQYARHPAPVDAGAQMGAGVAPLGPRLPLDLREPASLTERPEVISELTAPAVELEIAEIERNLLLHHVRAVGILATDVRDELFLADELRKSLPDVQLFFYGSNVLFLREDYRAALRGSLVLSTYPLFLESQSWYHGSADNAVAMFMSDEAEGIYNATLVQLGNERAMTDYRGLRNDSGTIDRSRPPIWITVIGRTGIFPVAVIRTDSSDKLWREAAYMLNSGLPPERAGDEGPGNVWTFLLALALIPAGLVGSFWFLQEKSSRRVHPASALEEREPLLADGAQGADWAARQRTAVSLLLHRELYVVLRYFALFGIFASALLVVLRPKAHGAAVPSAFLIGIALIGSMLTLFVGQRAIVQSARVWQVSRTRKIRLLASGVRGRGRTLWWIEIAARSVVLVCGLLYFMATVAFVWQVFHLHNGASPLFFQRAVAMTSGVSPALPLMLAGIGFAAWSSWHLLRIDLLAEPTAYGTFLLRKAEQDVDADVMATAAVEIAVTDGTIARVRSLVAQWLGRNRRTAADRTSAAASAQEIRDALFYLVPTFPALFTLVLVAAAGSWLLPQFEYSMETTILPALGAHLQFSTFDLLFRFGILAPIGISAWAFYRLSQVWRGLRRMLERIDDDLRPAFVSLPATLEPVTRLTPFGHPSRAQIQALVEEQWKRLGRVYTKGRNVLAATAANLPNDAYRSTLWPPEPRVQPYCIGGWADTRLAALDQSIKTLRAELEPLHDEASGIVADHHPMDIRREWINAASVLLAAYIADYVEWVFQHMRYISAFLLLSMIATLTLLASYPFQPQSVVKVVYLMVIGVGLGSFVMMTIQISGNEVLKAITSAAPAGQHADAQAIGRSVDLNLLRNLLAYGVIPLLTLLSSEFPWVRSFLFSWVTPLVRAFTKN